MLRFVFFLILYHFGAIAFANNVNVNIPKLSRTQLSEYSNTLKMQIEEIGLLLSSRNCSSFYTELEKRYLLEGEFNGSGILLTLFFNKKQNEENAEKAECPLDSISVLDASLMSYRLVNSKDGKFDLWPRLIVNEMAEENFYNILGEDWIVKLGRTNLAPFPIESGYKALFCTYKNNNFSSGILKEILDKGQNTDYSELINLIDQSYIGCSRVSENFSTDRNACFWLELAKHNAIDDTYGFASPAIQNFNLSTLLMHVNQYSFYFDQDTFKALEAKKRENLITSDQVTKYVQNSYDRKLEYFTSLILNKCAKHINEHEYTNIKKEAHNLSIKHLDEIVAEIESN